jgi:hypothetical protein
LGTFFDAKNEHRCVAALRCKEDPIYVFPVMKLRGLNPNFHINVSVSSVLYIPMIGQQNRRSDRGNKYKSLTDT